jgi:2-succinyl-5-enolpyruvyl-6-hydroxy-3-cyclohexene-1-carboxylate synthase
VISDKKSAQLLLQLCKKFGVKKLVISPGSRNAPLSISFNADNFFEIEVIVDERSAGFHALGKALASNEAVGLVCTSGSAMLNYLPAVAEAYYQNAPLLVLSADRPPHLIDQGDGQTIRQDKVMADFTVRNLNLPLDLDEKSEIIEEVALGFQEMKEKQLPLHLNIPFDEPLYNTCEKPNLFNIDIKRNNESQHINWRELKEIWDASRKTLIIVGQLPVKHSLNAYLGRLAEHPNLAILHESSSNLVNFQSVSCIDRSLAAMSDSDIDNNRYTPDLLISIGGAVVSKKIKQFLRKNKAKHHWHIDDKNPAKNTYLQLSKHLNCSSAEALAKMVDWGCDQTSDFKSAWFGRQEYSQYIHENVIESLPYSDLKAHFWIHQFLPEDCFIHMANSTAVRYVQLFRPIKGCSYLANRGTSGIDGSTSTFLGFSSLNTNLNVLLTGDLAFYYDANAAWIKDLPRNIKIVIFNNSGGGIFRIIDGPSSTDILEKVFEAKQTRTAKNWCLEYGFEYMAAHSEEELIASLENFFQREGPEVLEIFTPSEENDQVLKGYFKKMKIQ